MKPQEVKPKAQTDWLGFRKGVRTYVQRASLMMPSPETATKATMSLHVTAEHMSSKFTPIPFSYKPRAILTQNAPPQELLYFLSRRWLSHIRFYMHRPYVTAQHFFQKRLNIAGIPWYNTANTAEVFPE